MPLNTASGVCLQGRVAFFPPPSTAGLSLPYALASASPLLSLLDPSQAPQHPVKGTRTNTPTVNLTVAKFQINFTSLV